MTTLETLNQQLTHLQNELHLTNEHLGILADRLTEAQKEGDLEKIAALKAQQIESEMELISWQLQILKTQADINFAEAAEREARQERLDQEAKQAFERVQTAERVLKEAQQTHMQCVTAYHQIAHEVEINQTRKVELRAQAETLKKQYEALVRVSHFILNQTEGKNENQEVDVTAELENLVT